MTERINEIKAYEQEMEEMLMRCETCIKNRGSCFMYSVAGLMYRDSDDIDVYASFIAHEFVIRDFVYVMLDSMKKLLMKHKHKEHEAIFLILNAIQELLAKSSDKVKRKVYDLVLLELISTLRGEENEQRNGERIE